MKNDSQSHPSDLNRQPTVYDTVALPIELGWQNTFQSLIVEAWSRRRESDSRPRSYQERVLPLNYSGLCVMCTSCPACRQAGLPSSYIGTGLIVDYLRRTYKVSCLGALTRSGRKYSKNEIENEREKVERCHLQEKRPHKEKREPARVDKLNIFRYRRKTLKKRRARYADSTANLRTVREHSPEEKKDEKDIEVEFAGPKIFYHHITTIYRKKSRGIARCV